MDNQFDPRVTGVNAASVGVPRAARRVRDVSTMKPLSSLSHIEALLLTDRDRQDSTNCCAPQEVPRLP